MSKTVLFAGGPLHGKTMAVPDDVYSVNACTPPGDLLSNWTQSPDDPLEPDYEDAFAYVEAEVNAHMDNVVERTEASACYRADTCVMDDACLFIDNCRYVEA